MIEEKPHRASWHIAATRRTHSRPSFTPGQPITAYDHSTPMELVRHVRSDWVLRTRYEELSVLIGELGFTTGQPYRHGPPTSASRGQLSDHPIRPVPSLSAASMRTPERTALPALGWVAHMRPEHLRDEIDRISWTDLASIRADVLTALGAKHKLSRPQRRWQNGAWSGEVVSCWDTPQHHTCRQSSSSGRASCSCRCTTHGLRDAVVRASESDGQQGRADSWRAWADWSNVATSGRS